MNTLKKALCILLALCMFSIPSFAEDTATAQEISDVSVTEFSDIDYSSLLGKAVEHLVDKSVISGFPDGTYKADQTLTRAEFAKIIVCFLDNDTATTLDSGFPDVDNVGGSSHWAKSYIKIAKDMNIIAGFPDGTFMPDSPVTYEQAVKMIMCAKGYTNLAYPDGYMQKALQKKLLTNAGHTESQASPVSRGTTALLIYNAYSVEENTTIPSGSGGGSFGGSFGGSSSGGGGGGGGGGGSSSKDSRKITGIVWGTETTMLDTIISTLYSDEMSIRYEDKEGNVITEDLRVATKYAKNIDTYLGKQIRATITEDDEGKEYISAITVIEKSNVSYNISLDDLIDYSVNEESGATVISYYDNNEKKQTLTLSTPEEGLYVIYNDKSINMESAENYEYDESYMMDTKIGSLKFLSNDGDKIPDIIFVESYKTAVVNGKLASSGIIKFKYGEDDLNLIYSNAEKEYDRTITSLKNSRTNSTVSINNVKEFDVIDYKETVDKDYLTALITPAADTSVTGTMIKLEEDSIQIKNNSTDKKVKYDLNYSYIDYLESYSGTDKYIPQTDDNVKLYFNSRGNVCAIEEIVSVAESKYGYITTLAYKDADGSSDEPYIDAEEIPEEDDRVAIMLYQVDPNKSTIGSHTTTPILVSSTVRVDGTILKNKPEEVMSILLKAAKLSNEGKNAPNNKNTGYSSFIRYEMSGSQITAIDTVLDSTGRALSTESDKRFNTLFRSDTYIYDENGAHGGKHRYYLSSTAPGFYNPSGSYSNRVKLYNNSAKSTLIFIPGNRADKKYYSASKFAYNNLFHTVDYYIEAYNVEGGYAEFLLQFVSDGKDVITSFSTMAVVTALDDPDSESDSLILKYRIPSSTSELSITIKEDSPAEEKYDSLNVGDVILFSTSLDKNMYDFFHALDVTNLPDKRIDSEDLLYCKTDAYDRRINGFDIYPTGKQNVASNAEYRTIYGTVQTFDKAGTGSIIVNPMLYTDYFDEVNEELNEEHNFVSATRLFVYDEEKESVTMYSSSTSAKNYLEDNLFTSEKYGYKDADKVFIYTTNNSTAISSGEAVVRFVYLIRTEAQANPGNYEGVDTPDADPLAEAKQTAKNALTDYIESFDEDEYTAHSDLFAGILAEGKSAITEATSEEDIDAALDEAKAKADDIPSDSYIEESKATVEDYVDSNTYTAAAPIIENAFSSIESATGKTEIDAIVEEALAEIDEAVLTDVISDKMDELDELLAGFGYDFTEDTELENLIDAQKIALAGASSVSELNELFDEAVSSIEEYVNLNYPKDDSGDGTEGDGTEGDGTEGDGTEGDGTDPDGTDPDGTDPDGTDPDGTDPDGTDPDGTDPDGTDPDGTDPDGTDPDGTDPDGTDPDGTEE